MFGLVMVMIVVFVSIELFIKLVKMKSFKIRMLEGVLLVVVMLFNFLVLEIVVILFFLVVVFILNYMIGLNVL